MKKLLIKIKGLLGFCQAQGCKNRGIFELEIKELKLKRQLCEQCAYKAIQGGSLKSVTYEQTVNFDSDEQEASKDAE